MERQVVQALVNTVWLRANPQEMVDTLWDVLAGSAMQSTLWDFGSFDRAGFMLAGSTTQGRDTIRTFVCVVYNYENGRWSRELKEAVSICLGRIGVWDGLQGDSTARFLESIPV